MIQLTPIQKYNHDVSVVIYNAIINRYLARTAVTDVCECYPDYYGGAFLDDDKILNINVTQEVDVIEELELEEYVNHNIIYNIVNHSYNTLLEGRNALTQMWKDDIELIKSNLISVGPCDRTNVLRVGVKDIDNDEVKDFISDSLGNPEFIEFFEDMDIELD